MIVSEVVKLLLKLDQGLKVVTAHDEYADFDDSIGHTVVRDVETVRETKMSDLDWQVRGKEKNREVVVLEGSEF